jgi:hypothetical protein
VFVCVGAGGCVGVGGWVGVGVGGAGRPLLLSSFFLLSKFRGLLLFV